MKIVGLSGAIIGHKTQTAMNYLMTALKKQAPQAEMELIDLADIDVRFSDGRNYLDYTGDTGRVAKTLMEADALAIGTPIFQASIPGTLKNIFDLLPVNALAGKVAGAVVTAGSPKHFLVAEQQLLPILTYMKAQVVHPYVFIEEKDFYHGKIKNDDILYRIDRLAEDLVTLTETYAKIRAEKEKEYGF